MNGPRGRPARPPRPARPSPSRRAEAAAGRAPTGRRRAAGGGGRVVSSGPTPGSGRIYRGSRSGARAASSFPAAAGLPGASGEVGDSGERRRSPTRAQPSPAGGAGATGPAPGRERAGGWAAPGGLAGGRQGRVPRRPGPRGGRRTCGRPAALPEAVPARAAPQHPAVRRRSGRVGRPPSPPRWGARGGNCGPTGLPRGAALGQREAPAGPRPGLLGPGAVPRESSPAPGHVRRGARPARPARCPLRHRGSRPHTRLDPPSARASGPSHSGGPWRGPSPGLNGPGRQGGVCPGLKFRRLPGARASWGEPGSRLQKLRPGQAAGGGAGKATLGQVRGGKSPNGHRKAPTCSLPRLRLAGCAES